MWSCSPAKDEDMIKFSLCILTAAGALALPALAAGQAAPTGNVANGKRLFEKQNCYYCHGTGGQGGRDGARIAATALNVQAVIRYVPQPTGGTPAFTDKMMRAQALTGMYDYRRSLAR